MRSRSPRRWSIAGAPRGSLSKTIARRAPPPSRETITCGAGGGGCSGAPTTAATPAWRPTSVCRRASWAVRPATPGARTSTSVGETIPGAKPRLAASSARRTWSPAGSARTRLSPRAVERTLRAAKTSSPMAMRAIGSATGREEATRDSTRRQRGVWCSRASSPVRRTAVRGRVRRSGSLPRAQPPSRSSPSGGGGGCSRSCRAPNSRGPNSATSAGTSVIETASVMSVVAARPGPKARKNCRWPTTSAAVPAATIRPAVTTIGATSATAARAAGRRSSPARSRRRVADRKKIE